MHFRPWLLAASAAVIFAPTAAWAADDDGEGEGLKIEYVDTKKCKRPTKAGDDISVHYRGTLQSTGVQFDASYNRGVPFSFTVGAGEVIEGWDEGLLDMCVGDKRKLIIPPELGYGSQDMGVIPPGSTLVFETELMQIIGVPKEEPVPEPTPEPTSISESEPTSDPESTTPENVNLPPPPSPIPMAPFEGSENGPQHILDNQNGECKLLGPFALIVQAALGGIALLSLVFKRWRERPRRPLKIWFFDVSKQVAGTFFLHVANLGLSMFSSGRFDVSRTTQEIQMEMSAPAPADDGTMPNPCSFYLLNLAIDTTIGIPVLVIFLGVLHRLFLRTSLANPPESIKSGHYGQPPRISWWFKQSFIYFIGLFGMKLFVFFLFQVLPWLAWVGDWALRWTEGNEALQIAFVMFIFPVAMNAIQYYIIDGFIKDSESGDEDGFQAVPTNDDDEEDVENHAEAEVIHDEDESKRKGSVRTKTTEHLAEANPTAVPAYIDEPDDEDSRPSSSRHKT